MTETSAMTSTRHRSCRRSRGYRCRARAMTPASAAPAIRNRISVMVTAEAWSTSTRMATKARPHWAMTESSRNERVDRRMPIYSHVPMTTPLDLRSDTVTKPSDRMRRAMAEAEVGDDWYGDDPTVNRLQDRAAELTGKDAAIYVPTGTMATQIALHVFCRSGHYVAAEAHSHVAGTEVASSAVLSGLAFHRIAAPDRGQLTAEVVAAALEPDPYDVDVVDLVCVENTAQVGGGTVLALEELRAIRKVVADRDVPLYMDGARVFNACAAAGVEVDAYASEVDAMMFCLSKGLGAPIGSILCGPAGFIREARRMKITYGGGRLPGG